MFDQEEQYMNIVYVGAHQDDEAQALGTFIKYQRQGGHKLHFICTTNGDKGFSFDTETSYDVVAATRDREMRAVAAALDANYRCLGAPDEFLYDTPEMRLKLIDALRACEADLVFTTWVNDYNLDHTITTQLVFQATILTVIASMQTEHPALKVTPKIFYCDPGPGFDFEGTHYVELSEEIVDEKVRLINMHESQMSIMRQFAGMDYAESYRDYGRQTGARVGVPYAEVFRPCLASRRTPLANMLP
jgi:LmbE family N-acetylglucosaminyl deacetylase